MFLNLKNIKTRKDIDPNDVRIKITYGLNDKKTSYVYVYDVMGTREKYEYLYRANENNMELGANSDLVLIKCQKVINC